MRSFVGIVRKKLQWLEHKRWLFWILTLALVLRLGYVWHQPPPVLEYDAAAYRGLGHSLATGKGFIGDGSYGPTHWAPFTPFLLAAVYWLGGTDFAARIVWAWLSTGAIIVAFLLVRRRHGLLAANLATLGIAMYPYDIVLCGSTSTEVPSILLLLSVLFFFDRWLDTEHFGDLILFYTLLGVSVLNRPSVAILVLAPFASLWLSVRGRQFSRSHWLLRSSFGICIFITLVGPWSIRTSGIAGRPSLVTTAMPLTLWEHNNPWVIDRFEGKLNFRDYVKNLDSVVSNAHTIVERDTIYLQSAKSFILSSPIEAVKLQLYKVKTYWGIPGMRGTTAVQSSSHSLRWIALLMGWTAWVPLLLLFVLAVADFLRHKATGIGLYLWWTALMFVTTIPFGGVARYRLGGPIDIMMIISVVAFLKGLTVRQCKMSRQVYTE